MSVMWRCLEIPNEFSSIRIESDNTLREQIVAEPLPAIDHGLRISGTEIKQTQLRIVGVGTPSHATAVSPGFFIGPGFCFGSARLRVRIPAPLHRARFGIVRLKITRNIEIITTHAD